MPSFVRDRSSAARTGRLALVGLPVLTGTLAICSLAQAHSQSPPAPKAHITVSSISSSAPHVGLSGSLAAAYAESATITFAGRALNAPPKSKAALEESGGHGWQVAAQTPLSKNASFKLNWKPTTIGPTTVRIALRTAAGRDIAAIAAQHTRILNAGCAISQIAQADPTYGLIVGGLYVAGPYLEGGAMNPATGQASLTPQPLGCDWQPYTVTVDNGSSSQIQKAGGNDGYVFAALPGNYTLTATYNGETCTGSGTVVAGQQTEINTFCKLEPVP